MGSSSGLLRSGSLLPLRVLRGLIRRLPHIGVPPTIRRETCTAWMPEASLHLTLVADIPQSIALPWR